MCFSRALDSRKRVSRTSPAVLNRICPVVVSLDLDVPPKRSFFAWIRWFWLLRSLRFERAPRLSFGKIYRLAPPPQVTQLGGITWKCLLCTQCRAKTGSSSAHGPKSSRNTGWSVKSRPQNHRKTAKLSKNNENHTPAGSEPGPTPISGPYLFKSQPTSPFPMFLRGFGRRWGSLQG